MESYSEGCIFHLLERMVTSDGELERKARVEMYLYTEIHVGLFQCYET